MHPPSATIHAAAMHRRSQRSLRSARRIIASTYAHVHRSSSLVIGTTSRPSSSSSPTPTHGAPIAPASTWAGDRWWPRASRPCPSVSNHRASPSRPPPGNVSRPSPGQTADAGHRCAPGIARRDSMRRLTPRGRGNRRRCARERAEVVAPPRANDPRGTNGTKDRWPDPPRAGDHTSACIVHAPTSTALPDRAQHRGDDSHSSSDAGRRCLALRCRCDCPRRRYPCRHRW